MMKNNIDCSRFIYELPKCADEAKHCFPWLIHSFFEISVEISYTGGLNRTGLPLKVESNALKISMTKYGLESHRICLVAIPLTTGEADEVFFLEKRYIRMTTLTRSSLTESFCNFIY